MIRMKLTSSRLPWWLKWYRICLQYGRPGFDPWVGKIPWRREWLPTLIFLSAEFHGQRSLAGYGPRSHKESDTTEWLSLSGFILASKAKRTTWAKYPGQNNLFIFPFLKVLFLISSMLIHCIWEGHFVFQIWVLSSIKYKKIEWKEILKNKNCIWKCYEVIDKL